MPLRRYLGIGLVAGLVGGVLMSMVEMTTELLVGHSFFTPTYMIAAPLVGAAPMEIGMRSPGFSYVATGPLLVGMLFHFLWSGGWGVLFGALTYGLRLAGAPAFRWALAYTVPVAFVMSYVVLPLAGLMPIPQASGWLSFVLMHVGYGLGLATVAGLLTRPRALATTAAERQRQAA